MRRVCAEPGCPRLTTRPRCPAHTRRRSGEWRRVRAAVLADVPLCDICGAPASEVDHIVPLADGGPELDPANLQPLCRGCHAAKTSAER